MLRQEAGKPRKQKRTIKQLHADLSALGYDGSYNRVAAFARDWKAARQREQNTSGRGVFVPLAFLPGEAFQFDSRASNLLPSAVRQCEALGEYALAEQASQLRELKPHIIVFGVGGAGGNAVNNIGQAMLPREVIGGRQSVPAAADDDPVIFGPGVRIAPEGLPAAVPLERLRGERED
jgi:hypothetical protein